MARRFRVYILVFLWISIISITISVISSLGRIDPDFFSQLYVGKGLVNGQKMYGDFTDNKGPALYLFFSTLMFLTKGNVFWAFILGKLTILVLLGLALAVIANKIWPDFLHSRIKTFFLLAVVLFFGESFAMGGIYAESLGILMVFLAWASLLHKRYLVGGIFFGLAAFSRQTLVVFGIYCIYLILLEKKNILRNILVFLVGNLVSVAVLFLPLIATRDVGNFIYNSIIFNLNYAQAVADYKLASVLTGFIDDGLYRPIFVFIFTITMAVRLAIRKQRYLMDLILLFGASAIATYSGGIFYTHHFYQFYPLIFICVGLIFGTFERKTVQLIIGGFVTLCVIVVYCKAAIGITMNVDNSFRNDPFLIPEIKDKTYMTVVSFYPKLYFDYRKNAPDKYFQPFFISSFFNSSAIQEQEKHRVAMKDKTADTAFVFVNGNELDRVIFDEYWSNFSDIFRLNKVADYYEGNKRIDVYWSQ